MQRGKKIFILLGISIALILVIWVTTKAPTPPETPALELDTVTVATTSDIGTSSAPVATKPIVTPSPSLSVSPADTIVSWTFVGGAVGEGAVAKARSEIARLEGLIGSGEYSDYLLYVSIANQYDLLGDGANEFLYLKKALALDSTTTGLAWHNAGQLFTRLGAYRTARRAFEGAVAAQPTAQYHQALLYFLQAQYPLDTAAIAKEENALKRGQGEVSQ